MPAQAKKDQPNILLIMTDQQRSDSIGCYGADWLATPNLDRLAGEGVVFENCCVNNTVCTPSRASMFTGKHLPGHGVYRLHDVLPDDEVCFTERLRRRGYNTALFGKMHVSGRLYEEARRHPNDGFDVYEWCLEPMLSMDSPLNGYAPWLERTDPEFHGRLKREGRKVPLIIRRPGKIPAGVRAPGLVQPHDLAATILTAAGCSAEEIGGWMPDSLDLTPVANGEPGHDRAVCCYRNSGICDRGGYWEPGIDATMIRDDRYKLNVYHGEAVPGPKQRIVNTLS